MKITKSKLKQLVKEVMGSMSYQGPEAEERVEEEEDPLLKRIEELELRVQTLERHQEAKWVDVPASGVHPAQVPQDLKKNPPVW